MEREAQPPSDAQTGVVGSLLKHCAALPMALCALLVPAPGEAPSTLFGTSEVLAQAKAPETKPKRPGKPAVSPVALEAKTKLVEFENAPFPFDGGADPRRRKKVSAEDERYNDPRVLVHIPKGFDVRKPGAVVIFYHGHRANLKRDVLARQRVAEQISLSHANAVLVAPQFAVNASDSSSGNFWTPGLFKWFMQDVSYELSLLHGGGVAGIPLRDSYDKLDVIVVGYSGGYAPVAWSIYHGGANERLRGVVLMDALYGELDKFEKSILGDRKNRFFVSGYLGSTRARNLQLQRILDDRDVPYRMSLDERIRPGSVTFIAGKGGERHHDYVTRAWAENPIADLLNRLPEYRR